MGRMPYNVHVTLYRQRQGEWEFALLQRADTQWIWQGVCGGGESGESIAGAALREADEEAGVGTGHPLYPLDCISYLARDFFQEWLSVWPSGLYVLPTYYFAMPYDGELTLSKEHLDGVWLPYEQAREQTTFSEQKLALWELRERLADGSLERDLPAFMLDCWPVRGRQLSTRVGM